MFRNTMFAAMLSLGVAGAAQAEVYVDGYADSRSVVYQNGSQPTQVGGGQAYIVNGGDGPQVVNPQAAGAQRGAVAVITGGGDDLQIRYEQAQAPRGPRAPRG